MKPTRDQQFSRENNSHGMALTVGLYIKAMEKQREDVSWSSPRPQTTATVMLVQETTVGLSIDTQHFPPWTTHFSSTEGYQSHRCSRIIRRLKSTEISGNEHQQAWHKLSAATHLIALLGDAFPLSFFLSSTPPKVTPSSSNAEKRRKGVLM